MESHHVTGQESQIKTVRSSTGILTRNRHLVESIIDFTGGTAGGIATVYVGQPLDTVKVKMQTFSNLYRNSFHCFVKTYRDLGIARGLYAGAVPSLVSNIAENAVLFVAYGFCQKAVCAATGAADVKQLNTIQNATAGSLASFFSALVVTPTELVKCRLQAMNEMKTSGKLTGPLASVKHIGPSLLVKHVIKQEGIRGMFYGLQATWAREMPGYFCFFGGYEGCRALLTPDGKTKEDLSQVRLMVCGGVGGVSFWLSVFPMDLVKSRIQVMSSTQKVKNISFVDTMTGIVKNEGILALYNGLGPTVIRTFCATAALFLAYENTKYYMSKAAFGEKTKDH